MSATNGKSTAQLFLSAAGVLIVYITPIVALYMTVAEMKAEQAISKTERAENREAIGRITSSLKELAEDNAKLKAAIGAMEIQDRALQDYMAVQFAAVYRVIAPAWEKATGLRFPDGPHFSPGISAQSAVQPK